MSELANKVFLCSRCGSSDFVSVGKCRKCKVCGKYINWVRKKEHKGWHQWNKGLTKENDVRVANYGKKISDIKKNNPKYRDIILKNAEKSRKLFVSIEEIKRLYYEEKLSQHQIARKYGVSQGTVLNFMRKNGLQARPKHMVLRNHFNSENLKEGYRKVSDKMKGNTNWRFNNEYPNKEEKKLIYFFDKWNLPFRYVGDGSFKIAGKCPDFINEEKKLVIEFYGKLWHEQKDEAERIRFFDEYGWKCLVIWSQELKMGKLGKFHKGDYKWERPLYDKVLKWMAGLGKHI
jgi:very-short-patch-repair endonuclease/DNA-binding transcriptional regulator YiaG